MNRFLVSTPDGEIIGYIETSKTFAEVEKIYLQLQQEYENDTREIIDVMRHEYDIRYFDFEEDRLIID